MVSKTIKVGWKMRAAFFTYLVLVGARFHNCLNRIALGLTSKCENGDGHSQ